MPTPPPEFKSVLKPRTAKQQSFSTIVSIIIILLMVVLGAFYTWGKKIAEERALVQQLTATSSAQ